MQARQQNNLFELRNLAALICARNGTRLLSNSSLPSCHPRIHRISAFAMTAKFFLCIYMQEGPAEP